MLSDGSAGGEETACRLARTPAQRSCQASGVAVSSVFREIAIRTESGKSDRLFRAAVSAFTSLTRPSRREIAQLAQLTLPLIDRTSVEARRFACAVLSDSRHAPADLVQRLCEEPVETCAPLLIRSPLLSNTDLVRIIGAKGAAHARVIARRGDLHPAIAALTLALVRAAEQGHAALRAPVAHAAPAASTGTDLPPSRLSASAAARPTMPPATAPLVPAPTAGPAAAPAAARPATPAAPAARPAMPAATAPLARASAAGGAGASTAARPAIPAAPAAARPAVPTAAALAAPAPAAGAATASAAARPANPAAPATARPAMPTAAAPIEPASAASGATAPAAARPATPAAPAANRPAMPTAAAPIEPASAAGPAVPAAPAISTARGQAEGAPITEVAAGLVPDAVRDAAEAVRRDLRAIMAGQRPRRTSTVRSAERLAHEDDYQRLKATLLAGSALTFRDALAQALGIGAETARSIAASRSYDDMIAAFRHIDLSEEEAFLLVCAACPERFSRTSAIRLFLERYRAFPAAAATGIVLAWRTDRLSPRSTPSRATGQASVHPLPPRGDVRAS
jgi:uncharacterized protein (DUF2336 family)